MFTTIEIAVIYPPLTICGTICGNDNCGKVWESFAICGKSWCKLTICGKLWDRKNNLRKVTELNNLRKTGHRILEMFACGAKKMHLESVICELQIQTFSSPAVSYFCKAPQAKKSRFVLLYNGDFYRKMSAAGENFYVYTALQRRFL